METSTIVIKHYYTGKVLFSHTCEGNTQRITVEQAVSQDVSLRYANLSGFDLKEANLFGADLYNAFLREANLWGADLRDTDCRHATFEGAVCDSAFFDNSLLWVTSFLRASCRGTSFIGCAADNSFFREANLEDANFANTSLRGADIRGATTLGISFVDSWTKDVLWGEALGAPALVAAQDKENGVDLFPLPPYGTLMPADVFLDCCKDGYLTDDDGVGYYVINHRKSNISVSPSDVLLGGLRPGFPYVLWLNK